MTTFAKLLTTVALGAAVLAAGTQPVAAQWQYTDDTGTTKVKQYKADIPAVYRDGAAWTGPTGAGKPALKGGVSDAYRLHSARADAERRIREANAALVPYQKAEAAARQAEQERAAAVAQAAAQAEAAVRRAEAVAAQRRRDDLLEESVRLQRESVNLERSRQSGWRR
jgi:hypothetical protein